MWGINMKKCISVLLYLGLIVIFLGFDIKKLIDLKQMVLVVIGAVTLYIPSLKTGGKFKIDKELAGQNALWASLIQTFVLFYNVLAESYGEEERFLNTALACRPLLYGFCIWVVLHNDEEQGETENNMNGQERIEYKKIEERKESIEKITEEIKEIEDRAGEIEEGREKQECTEQNKEEEIKEIENINEVQMSNKEQGIQFESGDFIFIKSLPDIEECRQQFWDAGLTRRETEVAILILKCLSNAEIAEELYISETTVKKHVSNIFIKLKISRREQIRNILH